MGGGGRVGVGLWAWPSGRGRSGGARCSGGTSGARGARPRGAGGPADTVVLAVSVGRGCEGGAPLAGQHGRGPAGPMTMPFGLDHAGGGSSAGPSRQGRAHWVRLFCPACGAARQWARWWSHGRHRF
eukprot:8414820-Pyramimonas_sp.AAC.1